MKIKNYQGFIQTITTPYLPNNGLRLFNQRYVNHVIKLSDGDCLSMLEYRPLGRIIGQALLLHGLTGGQNSHYMQRHGELLIKQGYRVYLLNFRNAGLGLGLATKPYHSGLWQDLEQAIHYIKKNLNQKIDLIIGHSLGGNVLLKYLACAPNPEHIEHAIAICPPIELHKCVKHMQKTANGFFDWYFRRELRRLTLVSADYLNLKINLPKEIKNIEMFDELYTAPHWDFKNALDYYHHASSLYDLGRLKQNVNIIYSEDDPIIDPAPFKSLSSNSKVKLNSYPKAGHVAFYQWSKNQTILQKKILDIIGVN